MKQFRCRGGGVLPYIHYTGMCHWPGYGFQAFVFSIGYVNQENNVGNWLYNYIKLINSLIQVAINFLERHMDTYRIRVILFSGIQFRTGYQNQAKSSLGQSRVSGGPAAHPHQNFCSVHPPPPGFRCLKFPPRTAIALQQSVVYTRSLSLIMWKSRRSFGLILTQLHVIRA